MSSKIKILQVIPRLGHGGAETGCFDLAHYHSENNCSSFIVTSGGELIKYINNQLIDHVFQYEILEFDYFLSIQLHILTSFRYKRDMKYL